MPPITHLWTRLSSKNHEDAWVERLRFVGPENLVIKAFPASRTLRLQVYTNGVISKRLLKLFGGSVRPFRAATWKPPEIKRRKPLQIEGGLRIHNDRTFFLQDRKNKQGYPLLIPAEMAFGTGEHATTRSCLRILTGIAAGFSQNLSSKLPEAANNCVAPVLASSSIDYILSRCAPSASCSSSPSATLKTGSQQKWSCLDLGTGSGILALTAELLGALKILGIDFDQRCIKVARANAKANQLLKTEWQHADLLQWKIPGKWNLIAANIYSSVLKATARKVVKALAIHGHLILSGILACEAEEIESLFINLGLQKKNRIIQGKWGALHFQKC